MQPTRALAHLEGIIERGLETFIEVGEALLRIREERLYREDGYPSFEAYCQQRWGHRRAWADRHISAVRKLAELDPAGSTLTSEWQARQLPKPSGNPELDAIVAQGRAAVARVNQARAAMLHIVAEGIAADWPADQFDADIDCGRHATWEAFIRGHCTPGPPWGTDA